jgi:hypothetical protein
MTPVLTQMNPFHILALCFFRTHFNIILPCLPESRKWRLLFRFPTKMCAHILSLSFILLHVTLLDLISLMAWNVTVVKLLVPLSSTSFYFICLLSINSPHQPLLILGRCFYVIENWTWLWNIYDKFSASFETLLYSCVSVLNSTTIKILYAECVCGMQLFNLPCILQLRIFMHTSVFDVWYIKYLECDSR